MVTGEGELYQVKDKQKRKNHRELLVEYRQTRKQAGEKKSGFGFSTGWKIRGLFLFCLENR